MSINRHQHSLQYGTRYNFKVITLSGAAEGKREQAPRGAGLEGASTQFILSFEKGVFQQKFRPKICLKMHIFYKISCKIAVAPGA